MLRSPTSFDAYTTLRRQYGSFTISLSRAGESWRRRSPLHFRNVAKSLFDPSKAAGAESATASQTADARPITVSQASDLIKQALERHTPGSLMVVGQMSNLSTRDHWYFSLKDEKAVLSCVAWSTTVRKLNFKPRDGDEVVVTGHLSHYGPQGKTQMYVSAIAPVGGAGALEMKFRALCEELRGKGYFEDARKRDLPAFPRRIAVITSSGGAAVHDVINTASQRCKAVGLLIVDVKVQGEGAADDVARAIRWVDTKREKLGVDAILVTRGGGSIEDLWAFNERIVADAIFNCHLPIVAAIGHESDTTIAELVADVRASTPTQAAMRLVPAASELAKQVEHLAHRIRTLMMRDMERRREAAARQASNLQRETAARLAIERVRLERATARLAHVRPEAVFAQRAAKLHMISERLNRGIAARIDQRSRLASMHVQLHSATVRHVRRMRERLTGIEQRLAAVDPNGVLRRGYSITTDSHGGVVRSIKNVRSGEVVSTRVSDGAFTSVVAGSRPRQQGVAKQQSAGEDQFDLFG